MSFTENILASYQPNDELPAPELAVVLVFPEIKSSFFIIAALVANLLFLMGMCLSTGVCLGSRRERGRERRRNNRMMRRHRVVLDEQLMNCPLLSGDDEEYMMRVEVGTPVAACREMRREVSTPMA
eukprot:CAMPEP_0178965738 /NCGR_PEP_ID=MMETSP0789-20121207/16498_1 /TAXON_ID=3005 /ORGANISM="Rhizosolenia setigera, Strain CCMP 1694" /LENGTH=125 /DNA_ID=CAMNT_0020650855 /DNA_START=36 /DNA_END=413 /DNA_ORIENTATION=+